MKKKVFQCQVIHGDAQGVCQRSFKKCIMANAHDSTGCQKCKKKFHNRLAALRTASKVEIEAADNIFPIMGFSAGKKTEIRKPNSQKQLT